MGEGGGVGAEREREGGGGGRGETFFIFLWSEVVTFRNCIQVMSLSRPKLRRPL